MKRYDTTYLLKIQSMAKAQYQVAAAKANVKFSEWVREAMQDKFKHDKRPNGKRRTR